jgi:beta-lactamase class A
VRIKNSLIVLVLAFLLFSACAPSTAVPANTPSVAANQLSSPQKKTSVEVTQIASLAKGRVGVAAVLIETGETVASLNAQEHFPMQSVYKLPICMAVMQQIDAGTIKLDQKVAVTKSDFVRVGQHSPIRDRNPNGAEITVSELLRFAISESDGTASDVLIKLAGGPEAVQSYLSGLSINEMIVANTEKGIGKDWETQYRNYATPDAAIALLRALHEKRGLSESSQALLLKYMIESTPGEKRLKGLLPPGTVVAHKTGTSGTEKGITAATNDIGIITLPNGKHLAIAVFVSDSPADEATREGVIAKIAKAVWDFGNSKQ